VSGQLDRGWCVCHCSQEARNRLWCNNTAGTSVPLPRSTLSAFLCVLLHGIKLPSWFQQWSRRPQPLRPRPATPSPLPVRVTERTPALRTCLETDQPAADRHARRRPVHRESAFLPSGRAPVTSLPSACRWGHNISARRRGERWSWETKGLGERKHVWESQSSLIMCMISAPLTPTHGARDGTREDAPVS
jgi:hypothetical protein